MIAAASWPHSQHRSDNLRASTIGVRQHTSRKYSAVGAPVEVHDDTGSINPPVTCPAQKHEWTCRSAHKYVRPNASYVRRLKDRGLTVGRPTVYLLSAAASRDDTAWDAALRRLTSHTSASQDPQRSELVGMAGFEPAASCSQISSIQSPDVAPHRPMSRSPGVILAGRRLTQLGGCACWLPLWLPYLAPVQERRKRAVQVGAAR
jgi:hypothetical protein